MGGEGHLVADTIIEGCDVTDDGNNKSGSGGVSNLHDERVSKGESHFSLQHRPSEDI